MFSNASKLPAEAVPTFDDRGADAVAIVAKATFVKRGSRLVPAEEQAPVRLTDVPSDPDAGESSLRYASDIGGHRPGADILVVGSAVSPRPVSSLDVAVKLPGRSVTLRVHGERVFYKGALGLKIQPGAPFERAPVTYERAYGGASKDGSVIDWRNPVGRGAHRSASELDGEMAPCIEDPARPVEPGRESLPVGLGPIPTWWLPRKSLFGTMDGAWQSERMPLPPLDLDPRFHHVAPPPLQMERPLRQGDVLATHGLSAEGLFEVTVPRVALTAHLRFDGAPASSAPLVLDTALLEPALSRVELTLRRVVPLGRGRTLLREVRLDADR